jgi:His/Glu/Gln/Arg/opine family amino acid ABC transporter permease subunit
MDLKLVAAYWPQIWQGFLVTIWLSLVVLALGTPIAFLLALARQARSRWLFLPAAVYVNAFRALPALLVLFFAFYGLPQLGFGFTPLQAAIIGLTAASAAYLCEDIRAGIAAVDPGQHHAAKALGLSYWRTVRRIILPQAVPIMLPPYVTRAIIIVKGTALASLVAVNELTGETVGAISLTFHPFEFLGVAAVLYLALTGLLALVQAAAEHAFRGRYRQRQAVEAAPAQI